MFQNFVNLSSDFLNSICFIESTCACYRIVPYSGLVDHLMQANKCPAVYERRLVVEARSRRASEVPAPTLGSSALAATAAGETSALPLVCDRTPHHNFLDILANNWRNERHRYIYYILCYFQQLCLDGLVANNNVVQLYSMFG